MRKINILFVLIAILNLPFNTKAQISIGARAGLNLGKIIYSFQGLSINTDRLSSFTGGIPLEIKLSEYFALQPELNYITKGGEINQSESYNGYNYSEESEIKINYLELPVYAKFSVGSPKIKLDLFAGPVIGYGLSGSAHQKINDNGVIFTDDQTIDFEDDKVNRFDFSINVGAGASIAAGANRLCFDIHYQSGLSNMDTSESSGNPLEEITVKNSNFIFTVGFMTPLTTKKIKPQPTIK